MPGDRMKIWDGVYGSFAEAQADASVFDEDIWLGKVTERARAALDASRVAATVAPVAETREYALPIVAAMAAEPGKTLRILDFGGGLATSFVPLAKMLPEGQPLEFVVVEKDAVCVRGAELFGDDARVRFQSDLPVDGARFDIVHCGSSLHYIDDWQGVIRKFITYRPQALVVADLPAADNASFVTAQSFYGKRIPVRFWNFDAFVASVAGMGYALAFKARYRNPALDLSLEAEMSHFDKAHQLGYFAQLIFRPARNP